MKEIVFAGFGGQGVLTGGLIMAYIASSEDLNPVWIPSYGPSMRGGKANCVVKFADTPGGKVGSPTMDEVDILVAMNQPSLDYLEFCKPDATVFINTQSIDEDYIYPQNMTIVKIDCIGLADKTKNAQGASIVMAGAVVKKCKLFDEEVAVREMRRFFEDKGKGKYNDANELSMRAGFDEV